MVYDLVTSARLLALDVAGPSEEAADREISHGPWNQVENILIPQSTVCNFSFLICKMSTARPAYLHLRKVWLSNNVGISCLGYGRPFIYLPFHFVHPRPSKLLLSLQNNLSPQLCEEDTLPSCFLVIDRNWRAVKFWDILKWQGWGMKLGLPILAAREANASIIRARDRHSIILKLQ